jgi:hypothetical protein
MKIVTIPLSGQISDTFALTNAQNVILHVPVVTSCVMTLQVSPDTTSANFFDLKNQHGSNHLIGVGAGSVAFALGREVAGAENARFVTGVAQAAVRSLSLMVKL